MSYSATIRFARLAAYAAEGKKGEDIVTLDVRGQTSLTDYFMFISGLTHIHIRAIEDAVREALKARGAILIRTDGQRGHVWRALDYGPLIIHIMDKKTRDFYAMERLWERAKRINSPFNDRRNGDRRKKIKKKNIKKASRRKQKK